MQRSQKGRDELIRMLTRRPASPAAFLCGQGSDMTQNAPCQFIANKVIVFRGSDRRATTGKVRHHTEELHLSKLVAECTCCNGDEIPPRHSTANVIPHLHTLMCAYVCVIVCSVCALIIGSPIIILRGITSSSALAPFAQPIAGWLSIYLSLKERRECVCGVQLTRR